MYDNAEIMNYLYLYAVFRGPWLILTPSALHYAQLAASDGTLSSLDVINNRVNGKYRAWSITWFLCGYLCGVNKPFTSHIIAYTHYISFGFSQIFDDHRGLISLDSYSQKCTHCLSRIGVTVMPSEITWNHGKRTVITLDSNFSLVTISRISVTLVQNYWYNVVVRIKHG